MLRCICLVAHGNTKRYILATRNMKKGDLIRTSCEIPKNPGIVHLNIIITANS